MSESYSAKMLRMLSLEKEKVSEQLTMLKGRVGERFNPHKGFAFYECDIDGIPFSHTEIVCNDLILDECKRICFSNNWDIAKIS